MSRLPTPNGDGGQWGSILNDFLRQAHQDDGILKDGSVSLSTIASNTVVDLTSDQTVGGVKSFTSSPVVPTPTTDTQAANKVYVDGKIGTISPGNTTGAADAAVAIDSVMGSFGNSLATEDGAIAIGYDGVNFATADGISNVAIGTSSIAQGGNYVTSVGSGASANGDSSTALGYGSIADGEGAIALGGGTVSELGSVGASATASNALAVGASTASQEQAIAIGSSTANGFQAVADGFNNNVQSDYSVAVGSSNSVYPSNSVALGLSNNVDINSTQSTALGYASSVESGSNGVAINGYIFNSQNSLAIMGDVANASGGVAIGMDSNGVQAEAQGDNEFILGTSSHAVQIPGTLAVSSGVQVPDLVVTNDTQTATLEVATTLTIPTAAPTTPVAGQIWVENDGLYFMTANGTPYGPLHT